MNKKGFSLLELMTVLAILAVIAAIALPKISRSLKNAKVRECEATRVITTRAEQRYVSEHDGKHSHGIEDLLKAGYLQTLPRCTGGGTYAWVPELNSARGERRLICSVHGDYLPGMPANVPQPPKAPKSTADCPADMVFLPRAYAFATKTYSPVCAPKCPYGQVRRSEMLVGSCITPTCAAGYRWNPAVLNCVQK